LPFQRDTFRVHESTTEQIRSNFDRINIIKNDSGILSSKFECDKSHGFFGVQHGTKKRSKAAKHNQKVQSQGKGKRLREDGISEAPERVFVHMQRFAACQELLFTVFTKCGTDCTRPRSVFEL